jgi:hypothetical protein
MTDKHIGQMYWTDYGVSDIRRANLDGSGLDDDSPYPL